MNYIFCAFSKQAYRESLFQASLSPFSNQQCRGESKTRHSIATAVLGSAHFTGKSHWLVSTVAQDQVSVGGNIFHFYIWWKLATSFLRNLLYSKQTLWLDIAGKAHIHLKKKLTFIKQRYTITVSRHARWRILDLAHLHTMLTVSMFSINNSFCFPAVT